MAKTKISEFNANPALNTDIDSINIAEGCSPSGINDAIRELMAQLKDWQSGTSNDPYVVGSSGSLTLNQGTANGVLYLNGSKVVTSGSALTFDGTNLTTTAATHITGGSGTGTSNGLHFWFDTSTNTSKISSYNAGVDDRDLEIYGKVTKFYAASSEAMRLTSTGLGIGTSSPAAKLDVGYVAGSVALRVSRDANNRLDFYQGGGVSYIDSSPAGGQIAFATVGTERMRLDTSGNLGIGTSSPAYKLQITNTSASAFVSVVSVNTGTAGILLGDTDSATVGRIEYANDVNSMAIYTNGSERARIDSSGNLLIGLTSITTATSRSYGNAFSGSSAYANWISWGEGTQTHAVFRNGTNQVGSIVTTSTTTTYNTSSDYRLKNTIAPMTGALAKVAALKPVTYKWNADGSDGEGFIAHELAEVCPQAVTGEKDAVDEEGNPKYQGIDVSFLVATLTAAIQELKAEFDAYKASHP
jgi:hypothetical protein